MPKILNSAVYDAVFAEAYSLFQSGERLVTNRTVSMPTGRPLYRYVDYRNFLGQRESAGRTVWSGLREDQTNRWTGSDPAGGGHQGLYLSEERSGPQDTDFPELEHYQDPEKPPEREIAYFEYRPGHRPEWSTAQAAELRTMFLFTLTLPPDRDLRGLDLTYPAAHDLLSRIFENARRRSPGAFAAGATVQDLYMAQHDASFTRAVGNAALAAGFEFLRTTSVRDQSSINVVIGAAPREPLKFLKSEGRATFFVEGGETKAVVTIDDMIYNNVFGADGLRDVFPADAAEAELTRLTNLTDAVGRRIDWSLAARAIDGRVIAEVQRILRGDQHLLDGPVDPVVHSVVQSGLADQIAQTIDQWVTAAATADRDYTTLVRLVGVEGVRSLVSAVVTRPKLDDITVASYIQTVAEAAILRERQHYFEQRAADLMGAIASAREESTATAAELASTRDALKAVEEQHTQQRGDPTLDKEMQRLRDELTRLATEQKAHEERAASLDREREAADREREASETAATKIDRRRREKAESIFRKGERA
jgi:hypothetical protein